LDISNNLFSGSFPTAVLGMNGLTFLDIRFNFFTGAVPPQIFTQNLQVLFINNNNFMTTLPDNLGSTHILYLTLANNKFIGPIPKHIFKAFSSLSEVLLSNNQLTGCLPSEVGLLKEAIVFDASNNKLTGPLPVALSCLEKLRVLGLQNNSLTGPIPYDLSKLTNLKSLFLDHNSFSGSFPPPLISLHRLRTLDLSYNNLSGPIPSALISLDRLYYLRLDRNLFNGSIPPLNQSSLLTLNVSFNNLSGAIPSGSLAFCAGEAHLYTLDQLMRGSAELLGRGTMGTTYKAVLDNRLIVCVKRLDASKLSDGSKEVFEQHMESVGGLRHPNLVPLRAYFQAREERLLIYDYQPNGSLFSLIHGSKSTRAKPLHWTSCLKIAEDVAQGLSYIHQAWRLVHGNLKSSNVLLGPDFEACVSDYCLAVLANSPIDDEDDPDATAYKAPETRSSSQQATSKSDVYAFGVLLLELITGKPPSLLPLLVPQDVVNWVRSTRGHHQDEGAGEDNRLEMLLEVAIACSLTSPEQRPTMWQVLKMLQEIKETVLLEDSELDLQTGMP
ncbi:hypothetical protein D5086_025451, partial [Populus alba]